MFSFIELPRLGFDGRHVASLYVNTADIVSFCAEYDGQTRVSVRAIGTQGCVASVTSYIPLDSLVLALIDLAESPRVCSWSDETKHKWQVPIAVRLHAAAAKERADVLP